MRIAIWMGALLIAENAIGVSLSWRWGLGLKPASGAIIATACTAFVALLALAQPSTERWRLTEAAMRSAIAGTLVLVYLAILGIVAFWVQSPEQKYELPDITKTFVNNFTTVIGVVIAFYFGTSAYVQVKGKDEASRQPNDKKTPPAQT